MASKEKKPTVSLDIIENDYEFDVLFSDEFFVPKNLTEVSQSLIVSATSLADYLID